MTDKKTSSKAAKAASKTLRDARTSKSSKTAAGSALSQRPMSKRANITLTQADRAVKEYRSRAGDRKWRLFCLNVYHCPFDEDFAQGPRALCLRDASLNVRCARNE